MMAQFFDVLNQDKGNSEGQFFENQTPQQQNQQQPTVHYLLTSEKGQVQYPNQQIVVAEQLMVVDGKPQQVVIDQSSIAYQTQQLQQSQVQPQLIQTSTQYAVIQDGSLNNGAQQIFFMDANPTPDSVIIDQAQQTQQIVLNHQLNVQPRIVQQPQPRAVVQQPRTVQRPQRPLGGGITRPPVARNFQNQRMLQFQQQSPVMANNRPQSHIRQQGARQQSPVRQLVTGQVRIGTQLVRAPLQIRMPGTTLAGQRFSVQQKTVDPNDLEIKPSDEQEAVSLPDGSLVNMAQYKKMLIEQKSNNQQPQKPNVGNQLKKKTPPKNPRIPPKVNPRPFIKRQQNDNNQFTVSNNEQQQLKQNPNCVQQQMLQQQQQQPVHLQGGNYLIQPPKMLSQQRPLPSFIQSSQIRKIIENTPISDEYSESIRMLVLLENGEQRLITFTLPKEACTIQEILEQVNVPFQSSTTIQVIEANSNGLHYIVTVGNVQTFTNEEEESHEEAASNAEQETQSQPENPPEQRTPSPEPPKIVPKFIEGMLALCSVCGYLSENFASCIRCHRKLPDNVKSIPATYRNNVANKKEAIGPARNPINTKTSTGPILRKKSVKSKGFEADSVHVISSDEEEDDKQTYANSQIMQKLGSSVTLSPLSKEPSMNDIQKICASSKKSSLSSDSNFLMTTIICRTVRIGSYRCVPFEKKIIVTSTELVIKVPHPSKEKVIHTIKIKTKDIVKLLASFNPVLSVFFYYVNPEVAAVIRKDLSMTIDGDFYYDPLSPDQESHRRITLLPDEVGDEHRNVMLEIYKGLMEELNVKEANDILIKTCPKDSAKATLGFGSLTEIKQILVYPPEGRGRIAINTEDYICLAQDQFLNDVIIDFYLKYLVENLPEEQKSKVHVFSTFFYKRLTTKPTQASKKSYPTELDPNLTPAEKRHSRVKTWTKSVNLFEKDFIVVPINENAHWFLAIICFPGMTGCETWDGKPYKIEPVSKKKKTKTEPPAEDTPKNDKDEKPIVCEYNESDKDEADGEESEMESDDSDESTNQLSKPPSPPPLLSSMISSPTPTGRVKKEPRPPIKQPCILIFDSLAGACRSRVVATLRDYLTCEYKAKMGVERVYNRDVIKGANPKVPQQNNFTDCGLYVLQYVEQFFKDPIKDYYIPIKHIQNWFEEIIVTRKREDIANLIKDLMKEYGHDYLSLPDIAFPTCDGKIVEQSPEDEQEDETEENTASAETSEETDSKRCSSPDDIVLNDSSKMEESPLKPSSQASQSDFTTQPVINLKPDLTEFPRQTNKDTLSLLKAKRIIKHKNLDGSPDAKKMKN